MNYYEELGLVIFGVPAILFVLITGSFEILGTDNQNESREPARWGHWESARRPQPLLDQGDRADETLDPIHILFEVENSELRQSLIAKHGGFETLLSKTEHDILHTDQYGVLFRVWVPNLSKHFYYVKVINGTVENNGTRREYYKEVPPDMDTAKEAVAWTYGMHPDNYEVAIRT